MYSLLTKLGVDYTYTTTTTTTNGTSSMSPTTILILVAVGLLVGIVLGLIPVWKIFNKAGRPGWAAIVPFYNSWVLLEIVGLPGWLVLIGLIPFVGGIVLLVAFVIAYFRLAKLFGKGTGFAVCTVLFPIVCLPILGYGKAQINKSDDQAQTPPVAGGGSSFTNQSVAPVTPQPPITPTVSQPPVAVQPTTFNNVQPAPQQFQPTTDAVITPVQPTQEQQPSQPVQPPQNPPVVGG